MKKEPTVFSYSALLPKTFPKLPPGVDGREGYATRTSWGDEREIPAST